MSKKPEVRQFSLNLAEPVMLNNLGPGFTELCDIAHKFLQDKGFNIIEKIIHDGRGDGLSEEMKARYELACKIRDKKVMFGREGWLALPEDPQENK